jgi:hypothetical protein
VSRRQIAENEKHIGGVCSRNFPELVWTPGTCQNFPERKVPVVNTSWCYSEYLKNSFMPAIPMTLWTPFHVITTLKTISVSKFQQVPASVESSYMGATNVCQQEGRGLGVGSWVRAGENTRWSGESGNMKETWTTWTVDQNPNVKESDWKWRKVQASDNKFWPVTYSSWTFRSVRGAGSLELTRTFFNSGKWQQVATVSKVPTFKLEQQMFVSRRAGCCGWDCGSVQKKREVKWQR